MTVTTQSAGDNSTKAASTAYVDAYLPYEGFINHYNSIITAGNAFTPFVISVSSEAQATGYYQSAAAQHDSWTNVFVCASGTYTFDARGYSDGNGGIITLKVDGTTIGTIDLYSVGATHSHRILTGIALTAGRHTLTGSVDTRNASSAGWNAAIEGFNFKRTGN
jgi:hypothetical protein